jgi:hypothetical protein
MKQLVLLALVLLMPGLASAQNVEVRAPRLTNRQEILRERNALGQRLLAPGDSMVVRVFALIDEKGLARDLEIKDEYPEHVKAAVLALVRKMQFTPGQAAGKPKAVLLTIPVKLVRPREK